VRGKREMEVMIVAPDMSAMLMMDDTLRKKVEVVKCSLQVSLKIPGQSRKIRDKRSTDPGSLK
jgi:hypothetical protein